MAGLYIIASVAVIIHIDQLFSVLNLVFQSAFSKSSAVGGFLGATAQKAMQLGIARGVFSNESGLGSAPIAVAASKTNEPVEQGLISMTGTFIDTIIICSLTGIAILITGQWSSEGLDGATITSAAFSSIFGNLGAITLTISLVLFAFTTILGWSYYGERCFEFLFGTSQLFIYRITFILMVALGGFLSLEIVWSLADIVNGLMSHPNLIAILALSTIIIKESKDYFSQIQAIT